MSREVIYYTVLSFNNSVLVLLNTYLHFTLYRVKCEKQILPSVGFKTITSIKLLKLINN